MGSWITWCVLVVLAILLQKCATGIPVFGRPLCMNLPPEPFGTMSYRWIRYYDDCYIYVNRKLEYQDAQNYCNNRSADLVELDDDKENAYISKYALLVDKEMNAWIGINRSNQQEWVYSSCGTPLTFTQWDDDEPRESSSNCAILKKSQKWTTEECSRLNSFICERPYE